MNLNELFKKLKTAGSYKAKVYCSNCKYQGVGNFKKGFTVEIQKCPKCGCKGIQPFVRRN